MAELSFEALRKIQVQERTYGALSRLDEDFYGQYCGWLEQQKNGLENSFSIEGLKTYENSKKILEEVRVKRTQKILLKALKDYNGNTINSEGLSSEEKRLYLNVITSITRFNELASSPVCGQVEEEVKQIVERREERTHLMRVQLLQDLSEFVAPDGALYGPYTMEQVVEIKKDVAELLVKKNAAREFVEEELPRTSSEDKTPEQPVPSSQSESKGLNDVEYIN